MSVISSFMVQNKATADNFDKARGELFRLGIKASYDKTRMIFSNKHHVNKFSNVLSREANGLVLDMKTWQPLVYPIPTMIHIVDKAIVNKHLAAGKYRIFHAEDGTRVNLYYWQNKWIISTNKNFEMNNVKWNGTKTYQELLTECLDRVYKCDTNQISEQSTEQPDKQSTEQHNEQSTEQPNNHDSKEDKSCTMSTWNSFTSTLNTEYCYTFGFKHPIIHPFYGGESPVFDMWFIRSVKLSDLTVSATFDKLRSQKLMEEPINDISVLFKRAKAAMDQYMIKREINYGYILQSDSDLAEYSNVFVESSLMKHIRKLQYENTLINTCHENKYNKEHFLALNAYMDPEISSMYIVLFSQYKPLYDKFDILFGQITDLLVVDCQIDSKTNQSPSQSSNQSSELLNVAKSILSKFMNQVKLNIAARSVEQKRKIFQDYLRHPDNRIICESLLNLL